MIFPVKFKVGCRTLTAIIYHTLPEPCVGYSGETHVEGIEEVSGNAETKILLKYEDVILEKAEEQIKEWKEGWKND